MLSCAIRSLSWFVVAGVVSGSGTARGGDLSPAPGPVAPTMVTLDKLAPGRCLNDLPGSPEAVHVITESGSYFLTADVLVSAGVHGVLIDSTADRVSLDLNGFSIVGLPGSLDGVHADGGVDRAVVIFSEPVRFGAGRSVVRACGGDGVHVAGAVSVRVTGVGSQDNGGDGFEVRTACEENGDVVVTFDLVVAAGNSGHGVLLGPDAGAKAGGFGDVFCPGKFACESVVSCMNALDGVHVTGGGRISLSDVQCLSNGGDGIDVEVVSRTASEGFFDIAVSASDFNGGHGVVVRAGPNEAGLTSADKFAAVSTSVCGNGGDGFRCEDLVASSFDGCSSSGNTGAGFAHVVLPGQSLDAGVSLRSCSSISNGSHGVSVVSPPEAMCRVVVTGGECRGNGGGGGGGGGGLPPASGIDIDTTGGLVVPGSLLDTELDGVTLSDNSGDGCRVRAGHDVAMAMIRNIKAYVNGGSGVDVGPPDGGAPAGTLVVRASGVVSSRNGVDGARLAGSVTVEDGDFPQNTGAGLAVSGFPGASGNTGSCRTTSASGNGLAGISMLGMSGGEIDQCTAHGNGGSGIEVADSALPGGVSFGVRVDRCFTSGNSVGISVSGEHYVVRCGASHNAVSDLELDPLVFAGPSAASPTWIEVKPYAWP